MRFLMILFSWRMPPERTWGDVAFGWSSITLWLCYLYVAFRVALIVFSEKDAWALMGLIYMLLIIPWLRYSKLPTGQPVQHSPCQRKSDM